ncbi:MAG: two-component system sensor histidine kinase PhoQ [Paraglaciecola sp.]|jgi:two-component system sensor histidine kinase PhoQ
MRNLSLRLRSFAAAILALLIFIPLTALTLEQAFSSSLGQSMQQQLQIQSLTLISEFEMDGNLPAMPERLFNEQLNIPGSGLYAFIEQDGKLIWQSLSTLNWQKMPYFTPPKIGDEAFTENFEWLHRYFLFAYTAEFESDEGYVPISFYILQDKKTFIAEQGQFAHTLWKWLGLIALFLLILLLLSLNAALLPINKLIQQIKLAESGKVQRIEQSYPPELEKLKNSINHLLLAEQQQRSRYKNSLSDLAHSLKTPLAVLAGSKNLSTEALEPIKQIDNQIQRQLKRAVAGSSGAWEQAIEMHGVIQKLFNAMDKVYADKHLHLTVHNTDESCSFKGDMTDLMELLGNVIDNACKAARQRVRLTVTQESATLTIDIEDDGAGIVPSEREVLLSRGIRLDSYTEGQGIGMAVVTDLVSAYQGQLEIGDSELGGAKISLRFPQAD